MRITSPLFGISDSAFPIHLIKLYFSSQAKLNTTPSPSEKKQKEKKKEKGYSFRNDKTEFKNLADAFSYLLSRSFY